MIHNLIAAVAIVGFVALVTMATWGGAWLLGVVVAIWLTLATVGTLATIGATRARRAQPPRDDSWRWYPGEGGPPRG